MSVFVDIRKKLGDFTLDVKFEAEQETLALLGDSGCGKSMTLKCIAGVVRPDEGVIRINGRTVFDSAKKIDLKPQQRRVGYLFQNYALFPNMTVAENIMTGLERKGRMPKDERRRQAMQFVAGLRLDGLEDRYPAELSGGQQQRTALARILASEPDILLLDEPFSALDATLRWEMEQVVRATIAEFPGTTLLVTHDRDEVYRLSDTVAVYKDGHIDVLDEKWHLFAHPQTATAARLSGCKNLSPAHREGDRLIADDWDISFAFPESGDNADPAWVGLRAHRFRLCGPDDPYAFEFEVVNRIEDTFSYILQIRKRGSQTERLIRWEIEKALHVDVPDTGYVSLPVEEILLLRE